MAVLGSLACNAVAGIVLLGDLCYCDVWEKVSGLLLGIRREEAIMMA